MEGGEVGELSVFSFFWDDENNRQVIAFQEERERKKKIISEHTSVPLNRTVQLFKPVLVQGGRFLSLTKLESQEKLNLSFSSLSHFQTIPNLIE